MKGCIIAFLSGAITDSRGKRMCETVEIWRRRSVITDCFVVSNLCNQASTSTYGPNHDHESLGYVIYQNYMPIHEVRRNEESNNQATLLNKSQKKYHLMEKRILRPSCEWTCKDACFFHACGRHKLSK